MSAASGRQVWLRRGLLGLILANIIICVIVLLVRLLFGACDSCGGALWVVPAAGLLGYAVLLGLVLSNNKPFVIGATLALLLGSHLGMVVALANWQQYCFYCLLAAFFAVAMVVAWNSLHAKQWTAILTGAAPVGAVVFVLLAPRLWMADIVPAPGKLKVVVYERDGCPACKKLKTEFMPRLLKETPDIVVEYRDAPRNWAFARRLPTIILVSSSGSRRILESPESYEALRQEITALDHSLPRLDVSSQQAIDPVQTRISGIVVTEFGEPVEAAELSTWWTAEDGDLAPDSPTRTDRQGWFSIEPRADSPSTIFVLDKSRELGGVFILKGVVERSSLKLVLKRLVRVEINLRKTHAGIQSPLWIRVASPQAGTFIVRRANQDSSLLSLPPGRYSISIFGKDIVETTADLAIDESAPRERLYIEVQPTILAQYYGLTLPDWNCTGAIGAPADAKLENYRGKWVLIEFWSYW
jgi:hypothetical protein